MWQRWIFDIFWLTYIRLIDFQANADICGFNWIWRINTYPFLNVSRNHACHPVFQAGNQTWNKQHQSTWTRQHQPTTTNINQLIIQYQATNQHQSTTKLSVCFAHSGPHTPVPNQPGSLASQFCWPEIGWAGHVIFFFWLGAAHESKLMMYIWCVLIFF